MASRDWVATLNPSVGPSDIRSNKPSATWREVRQVLKKIRNKMEEDQGFTLIELMVVVLIIAILIAIAIPTFLGLRRRAQDRAAQSNLRNALTAAKAFYTDAESYSGFDAGEGETIEPSLTWADGAGSTLNTVNVLVVGADPSQEIVLNTESASGQEFCIADLSKGATAGTARGSDEAATHAACVLATPAW
jgi:type IV pilus assembly protein PilA